MAEAHSQPETTDKDLQTFYSGYAAFVTKQISRMKRRKEG
jgi:hypothetical protein